MQPTTYLKMIAGSLPEHGQGAVDDSLRILAQEALGVAQIHYLRSPHPVGGRYHYFALPSVALASELLPVTPLAMALPGHPAHQGPGAYVLDAGVYKIVALFDGEQMDLVCNETDLVQEWLQGQVLPVIRVPAEGESWRFQSSFTRHNALVERLSGRVVRFSLALLAIAGVAYGGLLSAEGWLSARIAADTSTAEQALSSALSGVQVGSQLAKQLADYQQRGSVAVRAGGWVDAYEVKAGKENFRIFVPSWITPDYIGSLGAEVTADRDPADEQLLVLIKGEPSGGKSLSSAETIAKTAEPQTPVPASPGKPAH